MYKQCSRNFTQLVGNEYLSLCLQKRYSQSNLSVLGKTGYVLASKANEQQSFMVAESLALPFSVKRLFSISTKKKKDDQSKPKRNFKEPSVEAKQEKLWKALFQSQGIPTKTKVDKSNREQDMEINEDSLWNAYENSIHDTGGSKFKQRKHNRLKQKIKEKNVDTSEDNFWNTTGESQTNFNIDVKKHKLQTEDENAENEFEEARSEKESTIQLTTKRNARKPPPNDERDKDMLNLLKEVISELDLDKEDGKIAKRELSKRFQLIQEQKAVTDSDDFESLLKEIKTSSAEESEGGFQWENLSPTISYANEGSFVLNVDPTKERLGIFNKEDFVDDQELMNPDQSSWSALDWYKHYSAKNDEKVGADLGKYYAWDPYDELMRWTNEGKLWKFPIDNEAGMEEEANVPFYEHVFLEDKLNEGNWCPKTGPIRNFMSSVTIALSQNAYLTVREKHEHIEWFRDYFIERLDTIKKLGLIGD